MCRTIIMLLAGIGALCGVTTRAGAQSCKPPRVLIVLDRSSSMVTGTVGSETKWEVAKQALSKVLDTYQSKIHFGLMVFPNPDQCGTGTVKVAIGAGNATAIKNQLATPPPLGGNWTPMAQTLEAAAKVQSLQDVATNNNVLLITDGWQWCDPYDPSTRFLPVNAATNLTALNITTYVVGFGQSVDALTLNKMAAAAKTKASASCDPNGGNVAAANNCYYQANDPSGLLMALQQITKLVTAEKCDNIDNDCDGKIDENLTRACKNTCGSGVETCSKGKWGGCTASQPALEVCDGKDNNCDGDVDEGCPCTEGQKVDCGSDTGECVAGEQLCSGGAFGPCQEEVGSAPEICDGKDNNCDGQTDENLTRPCNTDCGTGSEACVGGKWESCTAPLPSGEICDGLDNDCDGTIDGPAVVCANGGVCVAGACQAPAQPPLAGGEEGCDCSVGAGAAGRGVWLLLTLLGFLAGGLGRRRRR